MTKTDRFTRGKEEQPPTLTHTLVQRSLSKIVEMEVSLAYDSSKPWGDLLYEEEHNRKLALLQMPQPEWLACVNAYFTRLRGNGVALVSALAWAQQIAAERVAFAAPVVPAEMDDDTRTWRVWKDMVEEPYKYGSDIGEWIALDEEVRRGPKRWRVDAFWNAKVREIEEAQSAALVKIQALWRGHVARTVLGERFNCGRCLAHTACPHWLDDDDMYICRACKVEWDELWRKFGEELAAEESMEEVCGDCGEETVMYGASVGELQLCPECIHKWVVCSGCAHAKPFDGRCHNHCSECGEALTGLGGGHGGFCSAECRLEYLRDGWRD